MGKGILISILDISGLNNNFSRLPNLIFKDIHYLNYKVAIDLLN